MPSTSKLSLMIMAGGSGTRFWPRSTQKKPKQLLSFDPKDPKNTLLNQTLKRFESLVSESQTYILTTTDLEAQIAEQVSPNITVCCEPQARNTAPCIYWGAKILEKQDPETIMLVMPSDHLILNQDAYLKAIQSAIRVADQTNELVTLGIRPTRPETGYGYIETGSSIGDALRVSRFVEKPNLEKAKAYLGTGNYLWNAGMFVWKTRSILKEFDDHLPSFQTAWNEANENIDIAYPMMEATSIDYGILEKSNSVVTIPLECGWDDLGSWTALEQMPEQYIQKQPGGVSLNPEWISIDSEGNIVDAPNQTVATLGVNDLIVVSTDKVLFVGHKSRAQDIKKMVQLAKEKNPNLT